MNSSSRRKHIIIAGYSRSGTTMFYNMLRTSVTGYKFFDREVYAEEVVAQRDEDCISKRPLDIFRLDEIVAANAEFKELTLVIVIRDIRSIITSYHQAVPNDYFMAYDYQYAPSYDGASHYKNPGVIPTANQIRLAVNDDRFAKKLLIRYEDLVRNPANLQNRLGQELNLNYSGLFQDFFKKPIPGRLTRQLNGARPVDTSRLDGWRHPIHNDRIRSQFTRCPALFDLLVAYGYENDKHWFSPYLRDSPPKPGVIQET